jgi:hypothetical protein
MLDAGLRPRVPAGTIVVALDWNIAAGDGWPRIVIPGDPSQFSLTFGAGLDLLVLAPPGHAPHHVDMVVRALLDAGARIAPAIVLPILDANRYAVDDLRVAA